MWVSTSPNSSQLATLVVTSRRLLHWAELVSETVVVKKAEDPENENT